MAKLRPTGKGAIVKVNTTGDDTTFVPVGYCRNITPPPESKAAIDLVAMEDTETQGDTGLPEPSEFVFQELWDPSDTGDTDIDTLYAADTEVAWQIITALGTSTWTMKFLGKIRAKVPQAYSGNDPIMRQVTLIRTGPITNTVA